MFDLTWRKRGEWEDRRYQATHHHNEPYFSPKSLSIVFGPQGTLAWIISRPLRAAVAAPRAMNLLDCDSVALCTVGFGLEFVADRQLTRFKKDPVKRGQVMEQGLWCYTHHPNDCGDCRIWWGFSLLALAAGGSSSRVGPLLMSFLLLRVSGVARLETNPSERRPSCLEHMQPTNTFFPVPPRPVTHR